jgi:hypothetical protein
MPVIFEYFNQRRRLRRIGYIIDRLCCRKPLRVEMLSRMDDESSVIFALSVPDGSNVACLFFILQLLSILEKFRFLNIC